jgi:hypothetical protein
MQLLNLDNFGGLEFWYLHTAGTRKISPSSLITKYSLISDI